VSTKRSKEDFMTLKKALTNRIGGKAARPRRTWLGRLVRMATLGLAGYGAYAFIQHNPRGQQLVDRARQSARRVSTAIDRARTSAMDETGAVRHNDTGFPAHRAPATTSSKPGAHSGHPTSSLPTG
jgi:hypothetical protein